MKNPAGIIAMLASMELSAAFVVTSKAPKLVTNLHESSSSFQDDFIDKQKSVSDDAQESGLSATSTISIQDYLNHQQECFDEMSGFFNSDEATPPEVVPVLKFLVQKAMVESMEGKGADDEKKLNILDVGCGTGALFSTYLEVADELGIELDITGLDLSPKMVDFAAENSKKLLKDSANDKHSIAIENGDFVQKILGVEISNEVLTGFDHGVIDDATSPYRGKFDAVMINACFGNFYDSNSVVTASANCLKNNGIFVIAHPLGAEFVAKLGEENPSMVPNRLPSTEDLVDMLRFQPMKSLDVVHEADLGLEEGQEKTTVYYAGIQKQPRRMLREVVRLRGIVDEGYGRGGKKLGFPTANLPSSLFADALADVPTGVYVGSASIEKSSGDEKKGRGVVHKAVVNVGYSPTFESEENKEKIVEAHLIIDEGDIEGDFYGETMRLALSGFLRPEMKFPSFPDLIQAITNDVQTAKESLDLEPYMTFSEDPFLTNSGEPWVGKTGGDDEASYEFQSTVEFLSK